MIYNKKSGRPKYSSSRETKALFSVLARYMTSCGSPPKRVKISYLYPYYSEILGIQVPQDKKWIWLCRVARIIERNQHHEFDLKDYKSQILKHTQQLIREQKGNK